MSRTGLLGLTMLTVLVTATAGCFGVSQNPSYFPYLLPTGDVVRTHAKPIGPGYHANFDPHAVELTVEPQAITSQVGSQVVILATVRDATGTPRRDRRVEWMVTGGSLIEVDESGCVNGRGSKDEKTGVSFTARHGNRLTRGNSHLADDIMVRPGQTWCVVSSADERDTHVQVVVPGISNWDKRMKTTVVRWVDAAWEFPPRAQAQAAEGHELVTKIARFTDRKPLAKYRVRYKIIDGPPAVLLPSRTEEEIVVTNLDGLAKARLVRLTVGDGVNRVSVEIIRPPDPASPTGAGVSIVKGEAVVEWLAPPPAPTRPLPVPDGMLGPPIGPLGPNVPPPPPPPKGGLGPPTQVPDIKLGPPGQLRPPALDPPMPKLPPALLDPPMPNRPPALLDPPALP